MVYPSAGLNFLKFQAKVGYVLPSLLNDTLKLLPSTPKWVCFGFVVLRAESTRQALYYWVTVLTWTLWGFHFAFQKGVFLAVVLMKSCVQKTLILQSPM